jgi:ABC-type transporter Mla MlaB component
MFRITSRVEGDEVVLKVEGCLAGACVLELDTCWRQSLADAQARPTRIDLTDVCHVDAAGRELLESLYFAGAQFVTRGCVMRELLREISEAAVHVGRRS